MSETAKTQRVHIEFQRVQSWLFSAPQLRAMVGANTLLGETLRIDLPKLARDQRAWTLTGSDESYPTADPKDPIATHDDPANDARDGILSRDGGHFEAQFSSGAEAFANAARDCLRKKLPGLRCRISIDGVEQGKSQTHVPVELPVFKPCEWTGGGLASDNVTQGGNEHHSVSHGVKRRHEAAKEYSDGGAKDIASLLAATTKLKDLKTARELQDLVGSGYLALIHADGNSVGNHAQKRSTHHEKAAFFHQNRVLLRRALAHAMNEVCPEQGLSPLIPLMLGGDDLLLVSTAKVALSFVVSLCKKLDKLQTEKEDPFKLTLGVGVVFANHKIPIHRLHEVAEELASSAKRRYRGLCTDGNSGRSVVDWATYSSAWIEDPIALRRRDWLRGHGEDRRVLSQRPLDVIGTGLNSLEGLCNARDTIKKSPRSQLRYLVDQLSRGRTLSELAFLELSKEAKDALKDAGVDKVWRPHDSTERLRYTEILDLIEIAEIPRLGTAFPQSQISMERAHA